MAAAYAKWTGGSACASPPLAPAVHLLNGLYDAKIDLAPVLAITGLPYHDLAETFTQQDVAARPRLRRCRGLQRPITARSRRRRRQPRLRRRSPAAAWRTSPAPPTCRRRRGGRPPSPRGKAQATSQRWQDELRLPADAVRRAAEILNGAGRSPSSPAGARWRRGPSWSRPRIAGRAGGQGAAGQGGASDAIPTYRRHGLLGARPSQPAMGHATRC